MAAMGAMDEGGGEDRGECGGRRLFYIYTVNVKG